MDKINIIGLGPGNMDSLTLAAVEKIHDKNNNYLRTEKHPTIEYFNKNDIKFKNYDYKYDEYDDFSQVYLGIVNELLEEVKIYGEINYFVPGNPMIAERTVEKLIEYKEDDIIDIEIISGMSFIEPMLEVLEIDPINGFKIIDGADFKPTLLDINSDTIITQTYNRRIMMDLKIFISEIYGDEYRLKIVHGAGVPGVEKIESIAVYQMDRIEDISYLTSIFIPKVEKKEDKTFDINDLVDIIELLRGENGCPWDMKQTHESLRRYLIEESYELVNAIDNEDVDNIVEELGDVLLQVLLHSQIGSESGEFNLIDITSTLANKLIYRHPNIFSTNKVVNCEEVVYNWDRMKDSQRNLITFSDKIADINSNLPLLMKSLKTQKIAANIGFDWEDEYGPLNKIIEEYEEIKQAIELDDIDNMEEELGDLLFSTVNLARFLNIDPEIALNRANNKFINRFNIMEKRCIEEDKSMEDLNMDELNKLWDLAKCNDKK